MVDSIDDLSVDQLAGLTGEQITAIEENPEKINEILDGQAVSTETEVEVETTPSEKVVKKEASPSTDAKVKTDEPTLLNKSETGTIPYSTLQKSRKDVALLTEDNQRLVQELADERTAKDEAIAKTTELATAAETAVTPEEVAQAKSDLDAHMAVLEEEFPDQHAIVKSVLAENVNLKKDFGTLKERLDNIETQAEQSAKESKAETDQRLKNESIEAVDNNPVLAHWRDKDEDAFNEADRQDQLLRQDPEWRGKSFDDRFAEAVRKTLLLKPDASLPTKQSGTEAQLKAKAKAKVDAAQKPELTTLSDFQGAEGQQLSKAEELDNMDTLDMTAKLMKMSPEDQAAWRAGEG